MLRLSVLVAAVAIAQAYYDEHAYDEDFGLQLLNVPAPMVAPPAPAPIPDGPAPAPDTTSDVEPTTETEPPAPTPEATEPESQVCEEFADVCLQRFSACAALPDCQTFATAAQTGNPAVCGINLPFPPCFEELQIDFGGEAFYRAVDLGACALCCNDGNFVPATTEVNGTEVPAECTCRTPVGETPGVDSCTIPFFYQGEWHKNCISIDGQDGEFCGATLQPNGTDQLVPCAPFSEDDSCDFPDLRPADTPEPSTTTAPGLGAAAGLSASTLVLAAAGVFAVVCQQ